MVDPYKNVATCYDRLFEKFTKGLWEIGLYLHPPQQNMRVLDIGCGTGAHLRLYQKAGCDVFGIDMSPSMLRQARNRLGPSGFLCSANAAETPLVKHAFDLILISFVLHEMPENIRFDVVTEIKNLLKKDGRLVMVDYHPGPIRGAKGWCIKLLIFFVELAAGMKHFCNHLNFLSNKGLPAILSKHDLLVEKVKIVRGGNLAVVLAQRGRDVEQ
jgi:ubiquinone/menaquinone biosynthesis C-methylase UbiE